MFITPGLPQWQHCEDYNTIYLAESFRYTISGICSGISNFAWFCLFLIEFYRILHHSQYAQLPLPIRIPHVFLHRTHSSFFPAHSVFSLYLFQQDIKNSCYACNRNFGEQFQIIFVSYVMSLIFLMAIGNRNFQISLCPSLYLIFPQYSHQHLQQNIILGYTCTQYQVLQCI